MFNMRVWLNLTSDIKECKQNPSPCERLCTEEPGGYKCSCPSGLYLDQDKRSCKGKPLFTTILYVLSSFCLADQTLSHLQ